MFTASNEEHLGTEKLLAKLVFASVIFCTIIIAADELTTTIQNPIGPLSWLRAPLGIYLGIFPVGFLALAFLFPQKQMGFFERFGLSIAASISITVVSILLANFFLAFPITLARNLFIIVFFSTVFFLLFLFRASFLPVAKEFWEQYDWEFEERQKRFGWLKLLDIMILLSVLAAVIVAISIITRPSQSFNGLSVMLAPLAEIFLLLFSSGYFALYAFFPRRERSSLANLLLVVLLSMPVHLASGIVLFIATLFLNTGFSIPKLLIVSTALNFLIYAFIFFSERVMPIVYYWLDRRKKAWK